MTFGKPRSILKKALADHCFPAAVAEVGNVSTVLWREAFGRQTYDSNSTVVQEETVFDLASLTKILATTPLLMTHVERGSISLDRDLGSFFNDWENSGQKTATVKDLLSHSSGLKDYLPLFRKCKSRKDFETAICKHPPSYLPSTKSVYSDLGFILLAFLLEDLEGKSLATQFNAIKNQLEINGCLGFNPPQSWIKLNAPKEIDPWRGRLLKGEVHDENAWELGGIAGHSGLFGTASTVGIFARHFLKILEGSGGLFSYSTVQLFTDCRNEVLGSSRGLGWDTMLPTSSCGHLLSKSAFGHTGFTGTSLWIDPDRNLYIILLTNRVHPTRSNDAITKIRPAFHNSVIETISR